MRKATAVVATTGLVVFMGGLAEAAPPQDADARASQARHDKAQPLNLQHAQYGSHGVAEAARAKMKNDDCAGALDLFDEALRTSIDATLYRDRGLCHEKLDHPYPAADDYRRYLTNAPNAADADSIRERLELLQDKMNGTARSSEDDDSPFAKEAKPAPPPTSEAAVAPAAVQVQGQPSTRPDAYEEANEDELRGALRHGKGWSIAPFFAEHKWIMNGTSFGDNETWSECVGLQVRFAPNGSGALLVELGYEHFNSTNLDIAQLSGFTSMVGYEFRFPLDARFDNQLFLAPGIGYEQLQISPNDPDLGVSSEGAITGRLRFGYRRLLRQATAFEVSLDGGGADFFLFDGSGMSTGSGLVAVNLALAWGL